MPLTFERSSDTDAVVIALRTCNDQISYADLAKHTGLSVVRAKAVLASARRILFTQHGILYGVVRGEGLRRLTDADKVRKPEAFKRKVMRGAGREIKHLETIADFGGLPKADQHSVSINRVVLNVLRTQAMVKADPGKTLTISPPSTPDIAAIINAKMGKS